MKKILILILTLLNLHAATIQLIPGIPSNPPFASLTDAATITWTLTPLYINQNATVTIAGARTLVISGAINGMSGTLIVVQGSGGSRTLALPANSKVINNGTGAVTLSTAAGSIDILTWTYDGTNFYWNYGKNYN